MWVHSACCGWSWIPLVHVPYLNILLVPYLSILLVEANFLCGCTQHVVVDVEFLPVTQVLHCKMEGKHLTLYIVTGWKFMELATTCGLNAIPLLTIRLSGYMKSSWKKFGQLQPGQATVVCLVLPADCNTCIWLPRVATSYCIQLQAKSLHSYKSGQVVDSSHYTCM